LDVGIARGDPEWTIGHNDPSLADPADFEVWIASSRLEPVEVQLVVSFVSITTGKSVRNQITKAVTAHPNATTECLQGHQAIEIIKGDLSWGKSDPYFIHTTLKVDGRVEATDTTWPQPLKYLDFSNRGVKVEYSSCMTEVKVSAKLPVTGFVFSERQGLELSDSGIDIMPRETHIVRIGSLGETGARLDWTYVGADGTEMSASKPKL
jgi:beta-mannosidase